MVKTKIYLVENCYGDSNKVYIGKTKNDRFYNHRRKFGNSIRYSYIDEIDTLDRKGWEPLESYWIEQFRCWGFDIQNQNSGGGGPEFVPQEIREKISNTRKGICFKKEWKQKISEAKRGCNVWSKGKKFSKEHRQKISEAKQGKSHPSLSYVNNKNNIKPIIQYDKDMNFIKEWPSAVEAAKSYNISSQSIRHCCNGKNKTSKGFIWKDKKLF